MLCRHSVQSFQVIMVHYCYWRVCYLGGLQGLLNCKTVYYNLHLTFVIFAIVSITYNHNLLTKVRGCRKANDLSKLLYLEFKLKVSTPEMLPIFVEAHKPKQAGLAIKLLLILQALLETFVLLRADIPTNNLSLHRKRQKGLFCADLGDHLNARVCL